MHRCIFTPVRADGRLFEVGLSQTFLEYGLWQDFGTGKETPRGNHGDIGRAKKGKRRRLFSRKYYASVMNIKEFYEDNVGRSFTGILRDFARRCNRVGRGARVLAFAPSPLTPPYVPFGIRRFGLLSKRSLQTSPIVLDFCC